jgi:C-methyltransferase C-terminal domain/Putative zinc binding domain/Methyltransferase domain
MRDPEPLKRCRVSGSGNLVSVLSLGRQALTGVFPRARHAPITTGPLELVWCPDSGLLQLSHSYEPDEMYGANYGYRSGLNQSMVRHLTEKVRQLQRLRPLDPGDLVVDIGSNDATLLKAYARQDLRRVGIDPTGAKFQSYYGDGVELIPDFFSADAFRARYGDARARVVTSIAMCYDLEAPKDFFRDVAAILSDDGVWHFEQSYMPSMLRMNSYDTICHEHLEYYSLRPVQRLLEDCGLRLVDVQMNAVNGGSFAVTAVPARSPLASNEPVIEWLLGQEERMGLQTPRPFRQFEERVFEHRANLQRLVRALNDDGKRVLGYGASTKGNVLLQFCGFTEREIPAIAEVNPDKFGCFTPGTGIPIVSEEEARAMKPDYLLVLPWHFKEGILTREAAFLASGGRMIFPLPEIEIVGG